MTLVRNNKKSNKNLTIHSKFERVDVCVKDYLTWNNYRKACHKMVRSEIVEFPIQTEKLPVDPYILGILIGDGCLRTVTRLTNTDPEIIRAAEIYAAKIGLKLNNVQSNGKPTYSYSFTGERVVKNTLRALIKLLKLNVNSGDKFVPHAYKFASMKDRLDILAGLIDTDGSLIQNCYEYVSKSEQLTDDVVYLSRSLGIAAYKVECQKSAHKDHVGTYYRCHISGNINVIPVKVVKKQGAERKQIKNVLYTGFSIEYVEDADFYGFTLDADGRYLLDDFTITHNTGKTTIAYNLLEHFKFRTLKFKPSEHLTISILLEIIKLFNIQAVILDDMDRFPESDEKLLNFLDVLNTKVKLVIGICNNLSGLDAALLRPGRFDEIIKVEALDDETIKSVLGDLYEQYKEKVVGFPIAYIKELKTQSILDAEKTEQKYFDLKVRVDSLYKYYATPKEFEDEDKDGPKSKEKAVS